MKIPSMELWNKAMIRSFYIDKSKSEIEFHHTSIYGNDYFAIKGFNANREQIVKQTIYNDDYILSIPYDMVYMEVAFDGCLLVLYPSTIEEFITDTEVGIDSASVSHYLELE